MCKNFQFCNYFHLDFPYYFCYKGMVRKTGFNYTRVFTGYILIHLFPIDLRVNDNILLPDDETKFLTGQQTQIVIILSNFTGVYICFSY